MHDWITSGFSRVIFFEGENTVKALNKADNSIATLYVQAGRGAVVAEAGDKAFIAVFNTSSLGAAQVRIYQPAVSATTIDTAFAGAWLELPVMSDIGAGDVTQGTHRFAYIIETRTGFTGKPSPQPGNLFTPTSFTVAAGGRTVRMSVTVTVPANATFLHPIMTRIDNLDRWYFVPDAQIALTPGATTLQIPISISDERLADSAEEANDHFEALTQAVDGTGPFSPSAVFSYGNRLAYIVDNKVYFSDPDDYQFVTEDQHVVQVPGKRRLLTGCQLRGSAYLFGPQWTYEVSDNGDLPTTWAPANEVSSSIGTPSPLGIEWRTAGDYIWVVSRAGVYMFNGQYPLRPISYYNSSEWGRINWAASYCVQIRDDYVNQRLYVAAPLDGATEPTHTLVWDYARGLTPEDVDFSLDDYNTGSALGRFGSIAMVQDPTTLKNELWVAPVSATTIRKQDPTSRLDGAATIAVEWESGFVLNGDGRKKISRFGGIDVSIIGNGTLTYQVFGPDRLRSITSGFTLSATPGEDIQDKFDIVEENISVRFSAVDLAEWFDLSSFVIFHKPYATNR